MRTNFPRWCAELSLLALVLVLTAGPASAVTIRFETFDYPDLVPGVDSWSYTYSFHPGAEAFEEGMGFAIEFDPNLYASLETLQIGGFDALVLQPDLELPAPGVFDVLSQGFYEEVNAPYVFTVFFHWLGGAGGPGSQPYSLYTLDELGEVTVTGTGVTVPEPASAVMLLLALGLLGVRACARTC
jgi:hypothetical protein